MIYRKLKTEETTIQEGDAVAVEFAVAIAESLVRREMLGGEEK